MTRIGWIVLGLGAACMPPPSSTSSHSAGADVTVTECHAEVVAGPVPVDAVAGTPPTPAAGGEAGAAAPPSEPPASSTAAAPPAAPGASAPSAEDARAYLTTVVQPAMAKNGEAIASCFPAPSALLVFDVGLTLTMVPDIRDISVQGLRDAEVRRCVAGIVRTLAVSGPPGVLVSRCRIRLQPRA